MARWATTSTIPQDVVDEDVVPQAVGTDLDLIHVELTELVLHLLQFVNGADASRVLAQLVAEDMAQQDQPWGR